MDPEVRDAIQGHAPRTDGEKYGGDVPIEAKWIEILRLPRYDVSEPVGPKPVGEKAKGASKKRMETAKRAKERKRASKPSAKDSTKTTVDAARTAIVGEERGEQA